MSLADTLTAAGIATAAIADHTSGPISIVARILHAAAKVGAGLARTGLSGDDIIDRITAIHPHGAAAVDARVDAGVAGLPSGPTVGIMVNDRPFRVDAGVALDYLALSRLAGILSADRITYTHERSNHERTMAPAGLLDVRDGTTVRVE